MPDAEPLWTETCSMWSPITTPKNVVVCGGQVLCLIDTTKHNGISHIKFGNSFIRAPCSRTVGNIWPY